MPLPCDPKRTQVFLSSVGPIRQHFAPKRYLPRASLFSQIPPGPVRCIARIYQRYLNSVDCFLRYLTSSLNSNEVPQVDSSRRALSFG